MTEEGGAGKGLEGAFWKDIRHREPLIRWPYGGEWKAWKGGVREGSNTRESGFKQKPCRYAESAGIGGGRKN